MTAGELRRHAERVLAAHALAGADPAPLAGVFARCAERRLATGQPLFREGDPASELIFLLEGRVTVLKKDPTNHDREIGSWFAPALVGGLAAVEGGRRSASCLAGAPSVVATLPAVPAREELGDPGPAGAQLRFILLSAFTEALANTTQHLRQLLSEPHRPHTPEHFDHLLAAIHGARR